MSVNLQELTFRSVNAYVMADNVADRLPARTRWCLCLRQTAQWSV